LGTWVWVFQVFDISVQGAIYYSLKAMNCRFRALVIPLFLGAALTGCVAIAPPANPAGAVAPHPVAPKDFPVRIGVLPVINNAGSADGGIIVRAMVVRKVGWELGFILPKSTEIDDVLGQRDFGWSGHPGRLPLEKQDQSLIASALGVEGLLHTELNAFSKGQFSVYSESNVKARFWLTDVAGKKIWESSQQGGNKGFSTGTASLGPILSDGSLAPDVLDKVKQSPVSEAALATVDSGFATFPRHF
jgi:hypothetical protein